jgi:hypothetical protein
VPQTLSYFGPTRKPGDALTTPRAWYNDAVEIITKNRDILDGTPVFRGTRVPIQTLFDYLEGGETLEDFLMSGTVIAIISECRSA